MKNLVVLLFLVIAFIFAGCFTVNSGENAIVTSKIQATKYYSKPGLYFSVPFADKVNLIYMNNREALLNINLSEESGNNYKLKESSSSLDQKGLRIAVLVNWHVVNGQDYYKALQKNGQIEFNKMLFDNIYKNFLDKINGLSVESLNNISKIDIAPIIITNMSVSIDSIRVLSVGFYSEKNEEPVMKNTKESVEVDTNSSDLDLQNKMIESAYYQAANIKTQTEIYQAKMYNTIKKENTKFYNYFRLINVYKNSAKSKSDVPSFDSLYHESK
jgi:modulator of FtsH protease HflC